MPDSLPHVITSLQNPQVKRLVRLRTRRERERDGVMLIEGARELMRAESAGVTVPELFVCPELFSPEARELFPEVTGATELSRAAFEKVSGRENPDGVLGVAPLPAPRLPQPGDDTVVVVLHGLEKPGNVGAILRTADAAGAAGVLVLGRGADPYGPNVIRASQGAVFSVPTAVLGEDEAGVLAAAREVGYPVMVKPAGGGGGIGMIAAAGEAELLAAVARAPMHGQADSLNVATAAALVLYEALRQRRPADA